MPLQRAGFWRPSPPHTSLLCRHRRVHGADTATQPHLECDASKRAKTRSRVSISLNILLRRWWKSCPSCVYVRVWAVRSDWASVTTRIHTHTHTLNVTWDTTHITTRADMHPHMESLSFSYLHLQIEFKCQHWCVNLETKGVFLTVQNYSCLPVYALCTRNTNTHTTSSINIPAEQTSEQVETMLNNMY